MSSRSIYGMVQGSFGCSDSNVAGNTYGLSIIEVAQSEPSMEKLSELCCGKVPGDGHNEDRWVISKPYGFGFGRGWQPQLELPRQGELNCTVRLPNTYRTDKLSFRSGRAEWAPEYEARALDLWSPCEAPGGRTQGGATYPDPAPGAEDKQWCKVVAHATPLISDQPSIREAGLQDVHLNTCLHPGRAPYMAARMRSPGSDTFRSRGAV
jgi:hypothetical protein